MIGHKTFALYVFVLLVISGVAITMSTMINNAREALKKHEESE